MTPLGLPRAPDGCIYFRNAFGQWWVHTPDLYSFNLAHYVDVRLTQIPERQMDERLYSWLERWATREAM